MIAESWVESAQRSGTDFPIQNLPFGVFEYDFRISLGIAIGDRILDLRACAEAGLLESSGNAPSPATVRACTSDTLNALMALGREPRSNLRQRVTELLQAGHPESQRHRHLVEPFLVPMKNAVMRLPAAIGDYTDFFASIWHATNAGSLLRPGNPLPPNYKYVPIGYHGRASSIVVSGGAVKRPFGQVKEAGAEQPHFKASRMLDYEMEVGIFAGPGNALGQPIPIEEAESHVFGLCLLNDWSARDIQAWEAQPLGPFLAKSFATTISPWIVTIDALEPFRVPAFARSKEDPEALPHLTSPENRERGGIDLTVEVHLASEQMRQSGIEPVRLGRSSFRDLYWTVAQLLTHQTSNGCNLRPGDLMGSGTVSGPSKDALGCLLELTRRGAEPIRLPTGEERAFLEDGDEVVMRAYCEREGHPRIGFGECRGTIAPESGKDQ